MKDLSKKLETILIKYKEIEHKLSDQSSLDKNLLMKLSKEYAALTPLIKIITHYNKNINNIKNLKDLQMIQTFLFEMKLKKNSKRRIYQLNFMKMIY